MAAVSLEERVSTLESLLADFLRAQTGTQRQLDQLSRAVERTDSELRDADERAVRQAAWLSDEMRLLGERTDRAVAQLSDEMRVFKDEMRQSKKDLDQKWGDLSNKMGTLAEDVVAPSLPRIARQLAGRPDDEPLEFFAVRAKPRHATDAARAHEFDVVAVCGDYLLLNETKTRLIPRDVDDLVQTLSEARAFFPVYAHKKIIGALASLYVDQSLVSYGEKAGLLILGMGGNLVGVLNTPGFIPRAF